MMMGFEPDTPEVRKKKKEMVLLMLRETQIYVFIKYQIKWGLTAEQCVDLFSDHELFYFMERNESVRYILNPEEALDDIEGMLMYSKGEYPCGHSEPKDPNVLARITEEKLRTAVKQLLSTEKLAVPSDRFCFRDDFFGMVLSPQYAKVYRELVGIPETGGFEMFRNEWPDLAKETAWAMLRLGRPTQQIIEMTGVSRQDMMDMLKPWIPDYTIFDRKHAIVGIRGDQRVKGRAWGVAYMMKKTGEPLEAIVAESGLSEKDISEIRSDFPNNSQVPGWNNTLFVGLGFIVPENENGTYNMCAGISDMKDTAYAEGVAEGIIQAMMKKGKSIEEMCKETNLRIEIVELVMEQIKKESAYQQKKDSLINGRSKSGDCG